MQSTPLRIAAALCLLYLTGLLAQQIWWLFFTPTSDDPQVAAFTAEYRVTSSIRTGAIVAIGATVSILLLRRQTVLHTIALALFCGFVLWYVYLSDLGLYFRAPLGDGSISTAIGGWWTLHSSQTWSHFTSMFFLLSVTVFLGWQSYALRRGSGVR